MDRMSRAVYRLWGPLASNGRLHGSPSFAEELAAFCRGDLRSRAPRISKWSFGQQLEHLYLVSHYVLDRIEESMANRNSSERIGLLGFGLVTTGYFPRGVFKTLPHLEATGGSLDEICPLRERLKTRLGQINCDLDEIKASIGRSAHPRMKYLSAMQWLFFEDIHHRHHLAIMRDILKAAG